MNLNEILLKNFDKQKLKELDNFIELLEEPEEQLISILHRAQSVFGYIPPKLQLYIARKLNIGAAQVNVFVLLFIGKFKFTRDINQFIISWFQSLMVYLVLTLAKQLVMLR